MPCSVMSECPIENRGTFLVLRIWVRVDPELNISLHESIMLLAKQCV